MKKETKNKLKASHEIEKIIDSLSRRIFKEGDGHEFLDTCDIYMKAFWKYRKNLIDK